MGKDTPWTKEKVADGDDQQAAVYPHDRYLTGLTVTAITPLTPTEKKEARLLISKFCLLSEQNRTRISYTQTRPFHVIVQPPNGYTGDCSSYVTQCFFWARDRMDAVDLHDPNGPVEYDGFGFTGTLLATNHGHPIPLGRKYFVGDLAIFGTFWNTRHVTICRKGGYEADAIWSSHGSSAGPLPTRLRYRSDLLGVYRPLSLL